MSPNLNSIQHVLDKLKQRLDDPTPEDLAELHIELVEEWNNIMKLLRSMRHHSQYINVANGGNTCY